MTKLILISAPSCPPCQVLKRIIEKSDVEAEIVDISETEGVRKLHEMMENGLKLEGTFTPQCFVEDDNNFTFIESDEVLELCVKKEE